MVSSTSGSNGSGSAARVGDGALRTGYLLGGAGDGAEPSRTRRRRGGRRKLPEQGGGSDPRVSQQQETGRPPLPCTAFDVAYFNSYAHVGIHEEMIKDRTRTDTYKNAIFQHRDQIAGKVVLDVGCGTGILSIFCAQAGARRVYAVDASNIAIQAKEVIKANNLSGTVIVLHGRVEDVKIDEKVDVIVSEWMGYMLLYESMLGSVITARDRWLKPGGLILPSYATLYMAPISYPERYSESVDFWRNVYGIDMSAIMPVAKQCAFEEPSVEMISAENVLTWPCVVKHVDCSTLKIDELETVSTIFRVKSMMRAPFHGFAFWFDVEFGGPSKNSTKSIAEPADAEGPVDMVTEGDKPKKEGPVDTVTEGDKPEKDAEGDKPEKEGRVDTVTEGDKPEKEGRVDTVAEGDKPEKEGRVDTVAEGDKPEKEGRVDTVTEVDKPEKGGRVDTVAEGDKPEKGGRVDTVTEGDKPEKEGLVDTVTEGDKPMKEGPVDTVTEGDKPMKEGPVDTVTEGDKPEKEGPVDTVTEGDKPMKEGPVDTVAEGDKPMKEGPVDTVAEGDKRMKEGPVDTVTEGDRPKKRAKLSEGLVLSTAPEAPPTHWQQTMIYFFDPIEVEQDQVIEGSVTLTQSKENARYMNVHIAYSTGGRSYVKESVLR